MDASRYPASGPGERHRPGTARCSPELDCVEHDRGSYGLKHVPSKIKRNCSTCQFWEPEFENATRGVPMVGSCEPAKTHDGTGSQQVPCWPSSAVGADGAQLLTLFSFSCACWRLSITAGEEEGWYAAHPKLGG